jgi:hypothetical protein
MQATENPAAERSQPRPENPLSATESLCSQAGRPNLIQAANSIHCADQQKSDREPLNINRNLLHTAMAVAYPVIVKGIRVEVCSRRLRDLKGTLEETKKNNGKMTFPGPGYRLGSGRIAAECHATKS